VTFISHIITKIYKIKFFTNQKGTINLSLISKNVQFKIYRMRVLLSFFVLVLAFQLNAQCDTWVGKDNETEIKEWHTIYRDAIKAKDYAFAEEYWTKAYAAAPAADGLRSTHYVDGVTILKAKLEKETDEAVKKELKKEIISLYDQAIECYKSRGIKLKCETDDCYNQKIGMLEGRKGFDMYYTLNSPYSKNLEALTNAIDFSGDDVEYVVFAPLANIAVYQYQKQKMDKDQAIMLYENMNDLLDMKIDQGGEFTQYFEDSKKIVKNAYAKIEREIFDCEYFVNKLKPDYEADPDNPQTIKTTIALLKAQGCQPGNAFFDEIDAKWKVYAAQENAKIQAEFEAKNPSIKAKKLYDQGKFTEAVAKYQEAIDQATDDKKKAGYYFSMASIQFRKLSKYTDARKSALTAASLREGWGRPYMLIGDMYAKGSRGCGDDWNQRLAVLAAIEKYRYAKSVDPSVTDEANKKIGIYNRAKPEQDQGFMRGKKAGDRLKVSCWIGETVTLDYQ